MIIHSEECIKGIIEIAGFNYYIDKEKHSETLSITYSQNGLEYNETTLVSEVPMFSLWMRLLDYDLPNTEKSTEIFSTLQKASKVLPMDKVDRPEKLASFLGSLTEDSLTDMKEKITSSMDTAMQKRPALCFLLPLYYKVLHTMYQIKESNAPSPVNVAENVADLSASLLALRCALTSLKESYQNAREYCNAVFLTENTPNSELPPDVVAGFYRSYCMVKNISDYSTPGISEISAGEVTAKAENLSWERYLKTRSENYFSAIQKQKSYAFNSLNEFLRIGIDLMLESQAVLRVCKLCGGYFRIKYSSSQEYCTRLYRDTKAACNEYASRKSYKNKLFQHPIHLEFTKAYNKLYGRIRRGKVPADTPLMDELKKLHDEYYERYENTHHGDRDAIWREFSEIVKELVK